MPSRVRSSVFPFAYFAVLSPLQRISSVFWLRLCRAGLFVLFVGTPFSLLAAASSAMPSGSVSASSLGSDSIRPASLRFLFFLLRN